MTNLIEKIGVRLHDYGRGNPQQQLVRVAGDGWESIQLAFVKAIEGVKNVQNITPDMVADTDEELRKHKLSVAVLGAYVELSMHDEKVRRQEVDKLIAQIPIAAKLKAECIGSETTAFKKQPHVTEKEALNALYRSISEILPHAQSLGVTVAVEPVYYHALSTPELAKQLLDDMACKNLKVIFDPVNLLSFEQVETQHDLFKRAIDLLGDRIAAVHIKGVKRQENQLTSSLLTESLLDMPFVFDLLKTLPQPLTVLREEAVPDLAKSDLALIKSML